MDSLDQLKAISSIPTTIIIYLSEQIPQRNKKDKQKIEFELKAELNY